MKKKRNGFEEVMGVQDVGNARNHFHPLSQPVVNKGIRVIFGGTEELLEVQGEAPHLQSRALEQVNLSPRPTSARLSNYGPIPSPRPSPKVRISPRLAYMGLPSPRNPIPAS